MMRRRAWLLAAVGLGAAGGGAQLPARAETPPTVSGEFVVVVVLGAAARLDGPLAAARVAARRRARQRALAHLHAWADAAMARAGAGPREAQRVHDALEAATRARSSQPLVDGSVFVAFECPLSVLRAVLSRPDVPWGAPHE